MASLVVLMRRRPLRPLFALIALVLTSLGGAFAVPIAASAGVLGSTPQTITWIHTPDTLLSAATVSVSASSDSALPVDYSSLTASVCTGSTATITLVARGTCTIQADQAGDGTYDVAPPVTDSFQVLGDPQTVTWTPTPDQSITGGTVTVSATADTTVTYSSQTGSVCTVAGDVVTFVTAGTCTIRASAAADATHEAATADDSFAINKLAQTVTWTPVGAHGFGDSPIDVTATSDAGLAVTYTSTTTGVCTTTTGGHVTFVAGGSCTLRATAAADATHNTAYTDETFTISKLAQTVTWTPVGTQAFADGTVDVTASADTAVTYTSTTTGVCTTTTGGHVTFVAGGSCTLRATAAADATHNTAYTDETFTITKTAQTITFTGPADRKFGSGNVTLSATSGSGLTVVFTTLDTSICAVSGTTLSLVGVGTCTIKANQAGNGEFAAAPEVVQTFTLSKGDQTITFTPPGSTALSAGTVTVAPTATSTLTVAVTSADTSVCTVTGFTVTLKTAGTCTLDADQGGSADWNAAPQNEVQFTVTKGTQTISFTGPGSTAFTSSTVPLTATATSQLPVGFTSTTTGVCTVAGAAVTLVSLGTCTIHAAQAGDVNWNAATPVDQSFPVTVGSQTISFTQPPTTKLSAGTVALTASASSGLTVALTSTTTAVCTVALSTVTLKTAGTCSIDADQAGDTNWSTATKVTRTFTVGKGDQTVTFTPPGTTAFDAGTVAVTATATSNLPVSFTTLTAAVCTVATGTVTFVTAGTCTIRATQGGDADWNAAPSVDGTFTISGGTQTITFAQPPGVKLSAGTAALTASASSGLTVALTSTTPAVCTVALTTVTLKTAGTCTIDADQAGDGNWSPATKVTRTFTIGLGDQTITFAGPGTTPLSDATLTLTGSTTSPLAVTFSGTSPNICTVAGSTVTLKTAGSCSVRASQAGNADWNPATPVDRSFTVSPGMQTITFAQPAAVKLSDATMSLTGSASSGLTVAYTSTSPAVCTVLLSTVTLKTAGNCVVDADQAGDADWLPATKVTRTITVGKGDQTVTFTAPTGKALDAATTTVSATATSQLPVTFAAQTGAVCSVTGSTVTLLTAGTCTIRATQAGDVNWNAAPYVDGTFTVSAGAQTITFGQPAAAKLSDATVDLTATSTSQLPVTFTSGSPLVCTVAGATVTLLTAGSCIVTADQAGDGNWAQAAPVQRTFAVGKGEQTITFTGPPTTAYDTHTVTLTGAATSGLPVTFTGTSPAVCTVAGSTVTFLKAGSCSVQAGQAGDADWNAAPAVDRSFTVSTATQTITFGQPAPAALSDGTVTLTATATSGLPVTYTTSTATVCAVQGSTVTLKTAGACDLSAGQAGDANWVAATPVTHTLTITKGTQTVTFAKPADTSFAAGAVTLAPTATSGLPVTLSSADTGVCTVSGLVVTPVAAGACVLRADQPGDVNWLAAPRVEQTMTISLAPQTITFSAPAPAAISEGPLTLSATASSALPVAFSTASSTVCSVSGTSVTLLALGDCVVHAAQAGNAQYAAAAADSTLKVIQEPVPVVVPTDAPPAPDGVIDTPASNGTTAPGATMTLSGSGYKPNTEITVYVYSTPIPVGTAMTDSNGNFSLTVTVPATLPVGNHTMVAAGLGPDNTLRVLSVPVAVAPVSSGGGGGNLPVTGGPLGMIAQVGSWAVIIGMVLSLLGRDNRLMRRGRWLIHRLYQARHASS